MKQKGDLELIEREIKHTIAKGTLVSVILFGSSVNSAKTAKDYDILIITKKLPKKEWVLAGKIKANLLDKVTKPIDIIFLEEKDLDYSNPLLYEVVQKHKLLYGKNVISKIKIITNNIHVLFEGGVKVGWQIAQ